MAIKIYIYIYIYNNSSSFAHKETILLASQAYDFAFFHSHIPSL